MMFRIRTRRWLASWLSLAVLLTQFAVAAYACPGWPSGINPNAHAVVAMPDMPGCEGMVMDNATEASHPQSLLCKAHCDKDKQSTSVQPSLDLPSLSQILSFAVARVHYSVVEAACGWQGFTTGTGPPRGSPPVYLALLVLRN